MNLVFNRWNENGKPLPNLSELSNDIVVYPFFLNDNSYNIKKCKLEDINKDEKFYFIVSCNNPYEVYVKNTQIFLPKEIIPYIENFDLKVIFLCEHESHKYVDTFVQIMIKQIRKNKWKEENFCIIDNNSLLKTLNTKLNTKINFFKANYLIQFYSKDPNPPNIKDIQFDKKFIFLCQNRQPHYHRLILLAYLKNLNLLDNDIINWSLTMEHLEYMQNTQNSPNVVSLRDFKNYLNLNDKSLVNDYKVMCNTKKLCFYEEGVSWEDTTHTYNYTNPTDTFKSELNFKNSYIQIITESHYHFRETDVHITEKSFKPFYFFNLPLFVASYHHVKMMREEYDLDFFDDLIDHSYDNEIDDAKRMHMIINEIKRLSTMREEISEFYKNNISRLINNHNFVRNNNYEHIFKQYILNI